MLLYTLLEWLDIRGLLLFLFAFLLIADVLKNRKPPNFPPGPWAVPFLGNIFNIDAKTPHLYLTKLANTYGDIFSLRLGREKTVFAIGYKMMKEALITKGEIFVDRPHTPISERMYGNHGLFLINGNRWKKQRRFALSTLRNFGLGKKTLESVIIEESKFLQEELERTEGQPLDPQALLNYVVANVICHLVFGHRFHYTEQKFQMMLKLQTEIFYLQGSVWAQLYEAFPFVMKHLPGPHNKIFTYNNTLADFVRGEVEKHKETLDPSSPRDYIDSFLTAIKENKDDPDAGFTETNLVFCSLDLFLAGTDTTSTSLRWALLFMMKYPEIQEKVQAEIDAVIGQSRQPTMTDRDNMPYTDAVIHETVRRGIIVPLNAPRVAIKDTTLGGYFIPKGTTLLTNLSSIMFDKNEWETPDAFNPGHFLSPDGKFLRRDVFLPFSAGKRICIGEQLARMELFLFFSSLLQKFTFSAPPDEKLSLEGKLGITYTPLPYKLCTTPRQQ